MDIDYFRWILVGLGVVFVLGIYIREMFVRRRDHKADLSPENPAIPDENIGPSLKAQSDPIDDTFELPSIRNETRDVILEKADDFKNLSEIETKCQTPNTKASETSTFNDIVQLKVVAKDGYLFSGKDLISALDTAGLKYGAMNIFHKQSQDIKSPVFSVANLVEPGIFPMNEFDRFESPGLVFFLQLSASISPLESFDEMLHTAHILAEGLDGEICDAENKFLSVEKTESIRRSISELTGCPA